MRQTKQENIFQHDNLRVEGHKVKGTAFTPFKDGYDVHAAVTSYTYERDGEQRHNHVPLVLITDETGTILAEPHTHDSHDPEKAIENAKGTAEYVFKNLSEFVD